MNHAECNIAFNGLEKDVWEVRSVLNQEQQELGHLSASYAILNPHVSPLASHLYYPFQSILNVYVGPNQWTHCYLKPSCTSMASNWIVKPS